MSYSHIFLKGKGLFVTMVESDSTLSPQNFPHEYLFIATLDTITLLKLLCPVIMLYLFCYKNKF